MIPAPTKAALARIIAWRDSLYRKWARSLGVEPPPLPKNPRRVEGGRKAAVTRKANAANRRYAELEAKAAQVEP